MLFNVKFDLAVSIGEDCACSSYLRRFVLQEYSYPFDWLTKSDFNSRIELLLNDFKGFLNKEDLYEIKKPENLNSDKHCRYYADKKYDFYYFHDFAADKPFNEAYNEVKEKYERRITRMYERIKAADKVLFIWRARGKTAIEEQIIKESYNRLSEKFGADKIYLLIMEYSEKEENIFLCGSHVLVSKNDYMSYTASSAKAEVLGNIKNNNKIFSQIYKKRKPSWILKYIIFKIQKFLIGLIPVKSVRQKMREELKFKFDRAKL